MSLNSSVARPPFCEIDLADDSPSQSAAEAAARLPCFIGARGDAAESLRTWKLAVVAAGSVGRRIALAAARLQPAALWIVDPGRYKAESLLTQEIMPAHIGEHKATSTAQACKAISPTTRIFAFAGRIQDLPADALAEADACALSSDNLKAEVETGQRLLRLGIPLAHAGVHGETLVAQVRFFGNENGEGPCPACGFSRAEWDELNRQTTFRCGGELSAHESSSGEHTQTAPTMSTAFLCSLAADLATTQLVRHRLRLGKPVDDTLLQYCGYTHATTSSPLSRNGDCPCEHVAWRRVPSPRRLPSLSLAEVAALAGFDASGESRGLSFLVDDLLLAEAAWCCGAAQPIGRFLSPGAKRFDEAISCRSCKAPLTPQPHFTHRFAPASAASLETPLEKLGATDVHYIAARRGAQAALIRLEQR